MRNSTLLMTLSKLSLLCSSLLLANCAGHPVYPQNPLLLERLTPRVGYEGKLTNFACQVYDGDKCTTWGIKAYDLADPAVRKELNDLEFICRIGGHRHKVCLDTAGFCRITYTCSFLQSIFGGCDEVVTRIPVQPYQYLLDADTVCFSEKSYDWEEMQ